MIFTCVNQCKQPWKKGKNPTNKSYSPIKMAWFEVKKQINSDGRVRHFWTKKLNILEEFCEATKWHLFWSEEGIIFGPKNQTYLDEFVRQQRSSTTKYNKTWVWNVFSQVKRTQKKPKWELLDGHYFYVVIVLFLSAQSAIIRSVITYMFL